MKPIMTTYAGCRFRSRLEARWAVFFDHLKIDWQYEPQGYVIGGRPYLPDFLLTTSGTWIEVKGSSGQLDPEFMKTAARQLPLLKRRGEVGPRLMILGPIPRPTPDGDWGWVGLELISGLGNPVEGRYGFSVYSKNHRPWWLGNINGSQIRGLNDAEAWLTPLLDPYEPSVEAAYGAARSARFEHGESGAPPAEQFGAFLAPPPIINESTFHNLMGPQFDSGHDLPQVCDALSDRRADCIVCRRDHGHGGAHMGIDSKGEAQIWPR